MSKSGNLDKQLVQLRKGELLQEHEVHALCLAAIDIFVKEKNTIRLNPPMTIVGDIHGQFWDLLELFAVGDDCPESSYLFLGDYVDRGYDSVETFLLLVGLKVRYPERLFLLRGNHESREITQVYGFYEECTKKFGSSNVWKYCTEVFDSLPISAIIGDKYFCVHGGISPNLPTVDLIRNVNRFSEVARDGIISDILWSDPEEDTEEFEKSPRGAGYIFGATALHRFNHTNGFGCVVRAHQLAMEGYKYLFDEQILTVWSAPNYCYRCGNVASILELDDLNEKFFKIFEAAPNQENNASETTIPQYFL